MLYSHTIQDEKFNLFKIFISHILEGDEDYKKVVDPVIEQTQKLINGLEDYYTIDRGDYPIIVYLSQKAPELIKNLSTTDLKNKDYKDILKILTEQRELSVP